MPVSWAAAAVVAALALSGLVACAGNEPDSPSAAPTESVTGDAGRDAPVATPKRERTPFTVDLPRTQERWDPRKVDDLPLAADGAVPGLPAVIDPPASAPALTESPIDAAILAVEMPATALLLSRAGEWRSLPLPDDRSGRVSLSPDGRRLLIDDGDPDEDPISVIDLGSGEVDRFAYPRRYRGWDYSGWSWLADDLLLLTARDGGYAFDVRTGQVERVPFPGDTYGSWAAADDGVLVESADWTLPRWLTDWSEQPPLRVSMRSTGRLSHLVVGAEEIVATSYDGHPFSVIVADRSTLTPRAVLPVLDFEGNYSPGALRPVALRSDGTVLLKVSVFGRDVDGFRVVAWEPDAGDLAIVSTTDLPLQREVSFAQGLLSGTGP